MWVGALDTLSVPLSIWDHPTYILYSTLAPIPIEAFNTKIATSANNHTVHCKKSGLHSHHIFIKEWVHVNAKTSFLIYWGTYNLENWFNVTKWGTIEGHIPPEFLKLRICFLCQTFLLENFQTHTISTASSLRVRIVE